MIFGRRRTGSVARRVPPYPPVNAQSYLVAYENMLKGSKLTRRGKPIRQVAVVVEGTVKLVTSGDEVDRRTYDALIGAGVLAPPEAEVPVPEAVVTPEPEARA